MSDAAALVLLGLSLGASGGLAPGPLTALVVSETLRGGTRSGVAVALAPLLTDGPILVVTALALRQLDAAGPALGVVSLAGAAVLLVLAVQTARAAPASLDEDPKAAPTGRSSLGRAVATNVLNPHPWVFWVTVGTPATLQALDHGVGVAAGFLGAFFGGLVGTKVLLAVSLGRMRRFFGSRAWRPTMVALGLALAGFSLWLAWDGLTRLGLVGGATAGGG